MEEAIVTFQSQIKQLKEIIMCMYNTIVQNKNTKETILKKMEQINNTEIKEKEIEEVTQT